MPPARPPVSRGLSHPNLTPIRHREPADRCQVEDEGLGGESGGDAAA